MISIIICSIDNKNFDQVAQSIMATIGVEYEIIRIENTITNYGICKAYNIGANRAKHPYLCFMHEDILFKSANWGLEIIRFFEQHKNIGVVGIAGSAHKSLVPSTWNQGLYGTDHFNLIQHYKDSITLDTTKSEDLFSEVKTLDGVFLFTTKEIWLKNNFDEVYFDKFHCYDLDFCLQVGQKYKLFVCNDMLIEHFSSGSLNKDWVHYSIKLSEKWKHILPVSNLTKKQQKEIEWRNRKIFLLRMNILGYPFIEILKIFLKWNFIQNTSIINVIAFFYTIIGQKLKLIKKKPLF
jgi:GT2 family glycosyltransferase